MLPFISLGVDILIRFNVFRGRGPRRCVAGLLWGLMLAGSAVAATYRYNGNAPPAKMMLDLMEAMGVIERVPDADYGYRRWPVTSLWGLSPLSGAPSWPGANPMLWSLMASPGGFPGAAGYPGMTGGWPGMGAPVPGGWDEWSGRWWRNANPVAGLGAGGGRLAPLLEGIWIGQKGALLEFSHGEFTWSGSQGDANVGFYRLVGDILITRIPRYDLTVRYKIRISGNRLVAVSEKGYRYEFVRSP